MLEPLTYLGEKALARVYATWSRRELSRLHAADATLAGVIRAAAWGRVDATELAWFRRIEAARVGLLRSDDTFEMTDFGAGSRKAQQTTAEAEAGRKTTRRVGDMCRASKTPLWAEILFHLVRRTRPTSSLELGTCLGVSAAYQAAALRLNGVGRLTTCEGAPALADRSRRTLAFLGLDAEAEVVEGRFADTLGTVLPRIAPIDYVFIDGHHDEHATLDYFERIVPSLSPRAVVVFDDIAWSEGMRRCWRAIATDPRVSIAVDLEKVGVTLVERPPRRRGTFRIPLGWEPRSGAAG